MFSPSFFPFLHLTPFVFNVSQTYLNKYFKLDMV